MLYSFIGIILVAFLGFLAFLNFWESRLEPFVTRTKYIKIEIQRTRGEQREYWKRCLRQHYFSVFGLRK